MIRLALFQPEIPHNAGALVRLAACLGFHIDIIGPCGFLLSEKHFRRAGMDYVHLADLHYHSSYEEFERSLTEPYRLIAMTAKSGVPYTSFEYKAGDVLIAGCESAGLPIYALDKCSYAVTIPMKQPARSINLALSAGIISSEALRQLNIQAAS
ncbi:MAG: tRNA (cytidine(34)-2'-O)-methyltransferase [Holosporales bacterium]|jgi:tRNA (cytidine/uridine-2'-O-)-methyltransferase|nr:tRNA (cytidine(34)-2'-O)-methyltransferase [Holosporales bacterium]